jgi:hypothetical protein
MSNIQQQPKRGRPSREDAVVESKFTRRFDDENGDYSIWTFDLSKNSNGPIKTETFYKKIPTSFEQDQEKLPLTKQKFVNEENNKVVSYQRAKALNII